MEILVHLIEAAIFLAIVWMTVRVMALYKRSKDEDFAPVLETPADFGFVLPPDESGTTEKHPAFEFGIGTDGSANDSGQQEPALKLSPRHSHGSRADCMAQIHLIWRQQLLDWRQQGMEMSALYHPSLTRLVEHYIAGIVQAVGQHYHLQPEVIGQVEEHAIEGCLRSHVRTEPRKQVRTVGSDDECQRFYLAGLNNATLWLTQRHFAEDDSLFSCVTEWGLVA